MVQGVSEIDVDGGFEDLPTKLLELSKCPIRRLSLKNVVFRPEMLPPTVDTDTIVNTLQTLVLNNIRLTAASARQIQGLLFPAASHLDTVDCSHNPKLGPRGLPVILQCCNATTTTTLRLNHVGLGPFCRPPQSLPNLHTLELAGNNLGNAALYKWQHPLSHCRQLHTLDVSDNALGDDGIRALAGVLQTVVTFKAAGNGITTWEVAAPMLEYLDLSRNVVSDAGIETIVASWKKHDGNRSESDSDQEHQDDDEENWESIAPLPLRYLNLAHNKIASPGSTALAQGLRGRAPHLHTIQLEHNAMGDAGADAWVDAVDDLPSLRVLDVTPCTAARAGILELLLKHRRSRTETKDAEPDDEVRDTIRNALDGLALAEIPEAAVVAATNEMVPESIGAFGPRYRLSGITIRSTVWLRRCPRNMALDLEILQELKQQNHPHLIPVSAYSNDGCVLYSCKGRTLHELLQDSRRFSASRAQTIITCLADALAFLHDHACYHGDVQSETVVICTQPNGEIAKLTDVGLATVSSGMTTALGTRGYCCPRFERGSVAFSTASDVFSLGIVAAEVATGKLQNSYIPGSNIAWDAFYDLKDHSGLLVGTSEGVKKVIVGCLTHVVDQRPSADTIVSWLVET